MNDVGEIPRRGKDLLIVASVKGVLHFRSFDLDGKKIVDTDEEELVKQAKPLDAIKGQLVGLYAGSGVTAAIGAEPLEALKGQLASLWPPHALTKGEKRRIIEAATAMEPPR